MNTFGERLKQERKRLGMTQPDFALVGGVEKGTQINYEQDKRFPDVKYLVAIAAIGVDTQYVLHGEPSQESLTKDEAELLFGYRSLDIRGKANMLGMLDVVGTTPTEKPSITTRHSIGSVQFHGKVGNIKHGGQHIAGDLNTNVGGRKKKKSPEN